MLYNILEHGIGYFLCQARQFTLHIRAMFERHHKSNPSVYLSAPAPFHIDKSRLCQSLCGVKLMRINITIFENTL